MSKGKLFELLTDESEISEEWKRRLREAKESFLHIDPITDDALLDSIYDWFLKYFGEVK